MKYSKINCDSTFHTELKIILFPKSIDILNSIFQSLKYIES